MSDIGQRIKSRREALGLSQGELGDRLNVRPQTVYRIEVGLNGLSTETLQLAAQALNVSSDWILTGKEPAKESHYEYEPAQYADPKGWAEFVATRAKDYDLTADQLEQIRRVKWRGGGSVLELCRMADLFATGGLQSLTPHPLAVEADAKIAAEEKATGVKKPTVDLTKPKVKKKR